jgi:hypothetical protein
MMVADWIRQAGRAHQEASLAVFLLVSMVAALLVDDRHSAVREQGRLASSELMMSWLKDVIRQNFLAVLSCLPVVAMSECRRVC